LVLQHWHSQQCANAPKFDAAFGNRLTIEVGRIRAEIGDMNSLASTCGSRDRKLCTRMNDHARFKPLAKRRRDVVRRHHLESTIPAKPQNAEFCPTDARGILQHGFKYRLKLAWRGTNDLQHLRCCCLLLE